MEMLVHIFSLLNNVANNIGGLFALVMPALPGWVSNTLLSVLMAVPFLVVFKYTSNQSAIGKIKDRIKANMLAMKLYKDEIGVTLKAQGDIMYCALLLLLNALLPLVVMIVPVMLLFGQMGLWYQARPLVVGDETIVSVSTSGEFKAPWPEITLSSHDAIEVTVDKTILDSDREIWWKIKCLKAGSHELVFIVDDEKVTKSLSVGAGIMKVSMKRPSLSMLDLMLHPSEKPFPKVSKIRAIEVIYPKSDAFTCGKDNWVIWFLIVSIITAFVLKPFLGVKF